MNNKMQELRQAKGDLVTRMKNLLDKADDQRRALTSAEDAEYKRLDAEVDRISEEIRSFEQGDSRRLKLRAEIAELDKVVNPLPGHIRAGGDWRGEGPEDGGFRNVAEYFHAIAAFKRDGTRDERLDAMREIREQTMGTGATGGFAVPKLFDGNVRQVTPQEAIVRPRATVIPAGSPPDAEISFLSCDQTADQNTYGGVVVYHSGEGVTMTESSFHLRETTLEPKEISGYLVCTQKLLNNWEAAGSVLQQQLRRAVNGQEDYDFMRGDGVNKALGFINAGAAIAYNRAGAGAIAYNDVVGMLARADLESGNLLWIASQTVVPQLAAMVDAGNHAVWPSPMSGSAAAPLPSTLLGVPIRFAKRLPALGTKGDLSLVDLSYYTIKDGSFMAASSEHVYFLNNKVVFKIVWNVDGRPWLTEPYALEGSTSNTISPFVVLN